MEEMMDNTTNVIQQTTDYNRFQFLTDNREQTRGHIENIKKAIEEIGNLTQVQPILVNDRFQIIDGQHRFTACMELGLPIFYTQVPGLGINEARQMNILHRGWRAEDYARSYALGGNNNYRRFLELKEDYGFSFSIILGYLYGTTERQGIYKTFREGGLELTEEMLPEVRDRLDKLAEIYEVTPLARSKEFAFALLEIMKQEGYNHRRMVAKIRLHGETLLRRLNNQGDNSRQLEEVYNYASRASNRVRLY